MEFLHSRIQQLSSARRFRLLIMLLIGLGGTIRLSAAESLSATPAANPWQDDATLRDVTFVGNTGFAVGDHGSVWKTTDGGLNWQFVSVPAELQDVHWQSVCFLTNSIGWIAGGRHQPYQRVSEGVICHTVDGGLTWQRLDLPHLPAVKVLRFFDLEEGSLLCEPTARYPSGVLKTTDGGTNWQSLQAKKSSRWRTAAFVNPEHGVLAGDLGEHAVTARGQVVPPPYPPSGLQSWLGLAIQPGRTSWAVGDGAVLLSSEDAGITWELPEHLPPAELAEFSRFQSVAAQGDHVWIAGAPGSVIWHSPDRGTSWQPQSTGITTPLCKLSFRTPLQGCAVGTLGCILITDDGGQTWQVRRGAARRAAVLNLHAHPQRISLPLLVRTGSEEGNRCVVSVLSRQDIGPDGFQHRDAESQLRAMVLAAGGNDSQINWRLPLAVPGIARQRQRLLDDWSLLTDRRLPEVMLNDLVAQLRIWRPSVVVLDAAPADDAATQLLKQAVEVAVLQAADPEAYPLQQRLCHLPVCQVEKIVVRQTPGSSGTFRIDPADLLPRRGMVVGDAVRLAAAVSPLAVDHPESRHEFQVVWSHRPGPEATGSLLGGLAVPIDQTARRNLPPLREYDIDRLAAQSRHRRTLAAVVERVSTQPGGSGNLIAQLDGLLAPLPPGEAAHQLWQLARQYQAAGEWALAEETLANLIDRYPQEAVTVEAMKWLVMYWTSLELNWQRLRALGGSSQQTIEKNSQQLQADLQRAVDTILKAETETGRKLQLQQLDLENSASSGILRASGQRVQLTAVDLQRAQQMSRWLEVAGLLSERLQQQAPRLEQDAEFQFSLAALHRRRQKHRAADAILDRYLQTLSDDPWQIAARGEAYLLRPGTLSPKPVNTARRIDQPPVLDGLLSDPCWQQAAEIELVADPENGEFVGSRRTAARKGTVSGPRTVVMFCYDDEYLYIAATLPWEAGLERGAVQYAGRPRDADVRQFDRLQFSFDIDRDYATTYDFVVDQRGWTREACWGDARYNPEWFVAVEHDATVWRLETAILLADLVPPGGLMGQTWSVGITRILPGLGTQSWTAAGGETPLPPKFGLLQFGR